MAGIRRMNKDFLIEFIELYRSLPCLWKIKSKDYSDRTKKNKAYEEMIAKLQEVDPDANRESVKKKIDSMRGCFRKEMNKIKKSKKSGAGSEDISKPRLWYFDHLLFLYDQEIPREAVSNMDETASNIDEESIHHSDKDESEDEAENRPPLSVLSNEHDETISGQPSPSTSTIRSTPYSIRSVQRAKKARPNADDILKKVDQQLDEARKQDDEFDIIGKNFANKLRNLPKETAMVAEKLMLDIAYEAQLGNVDKNTRLTLYTTPQHQVSQPYSNTTVPTTTSASSFFSHFVGDYSYTNI